MIEYFCPFPKEKKNADANTGAAFLFISIVLLPLRNHVD